MEWIVLEFRVHDNEPEVVDLDSPMQGVEQVLAEAFAQPPHCLVGTSAGGRQLLAFVRTTDRCSVLDRARVVTPAVGMASVTARVWSRDPRSGAEADEVLTVIHPQPYRLGQHLDALIAEHLAQAGPVCSWSKH
jgi:hypothetical protein